MPRVTTIKTNFTAGELSPRLLGRIDVQRYQNGCKQLVNAYCLVHGGARRRQGKRFIRGAKHDDKQTRLVPFIFSRDQRFMLEFGDQYVRFYTPSGVILDGGSPYELATPYLEADLDLIKYHQRADTLFLWHPTYHPRILQRFSNTDWRIQLAPFTVPPTEELGERPNTTLSLSATTGTVTATAGADAFGASDVGRGITSGSGAGTITAVGSATSATVSVTSAFASTGPIAANAWKITESPKTTCTPSVKEPIGAAVTLTAGAAAWKSYAANTHVGKFVEVNDGLVEITSLASATVANGIIRSLLSATAAASSGGWALRSAVWNSVDGYPRAGSIYQQRLVAGGSANYPQTLWGSKSGEYFNFADGVNDNDGFIFGLDSDEVNPIEHLVSTRVLLPLTYGGEFSMSGGATKRALTPTNVEANLETTYGCSITRPVRVANEIIFAQRGDQKIRSLGYDFGRDSFNAPDISVLSEHITKPGILEMAFAKHPDQVVWMVRSDGVAVSMSIDRDQDAIGFARHTTDGEIESVATIPGDDYDQVWWVVRRTIGGTVKRYIEVFEEGLQTDSAVTGAVAESAIVSATWSGGTVTVTQTAHGYTTGDTIRLSGFTPAGYNGEHEITVTGANTYTFALADDPGATSVVGTAAKATASWSGLSHLEGKTVDLLGDGVYLGTATVASGAVTLPEAAYAVEIGLHFKTTVQTLPPEVPTGQGTAQGNALSIHEIIVRLYDTIGVKINGKQIPFRKFGDSVLDQPVPAFTGDKRAENLGWGRAGGGDGTDDEGTVTIEQDQPYRMQLLAVITRLTVNDG